MSVATYAVVGTILGTIAFLIVPGVVYAYYVLETWMDSSERYPEI